MLYKSPSKSSLIVSPGFVCNQKANYSKVVRKPNNHAVNQYLKILRTTILDWRPSMVGCPYGVRPTCDNTLMVDDNASKNILNLTSKFMICPTWTVGKVQGRFFVRPH